MLIVAEIPRKGFAIGEFIPITIDYKNESNVDIYRTGIRLIREITKKCPIEGNPKIKKSEKVIFNSEIEGVPKRSSKTVKCKFKVPNIYASNNHHCHIISIAYFIKIVAKSSGMHKYKIIRLPVIIGDVPLRIDSS